MTNRKTPKKDGSKDKQVVESEDKANGDFASEVRKRVSAVVSKDKADIVTAQILAAYSENFSGPIAHPKHLRLYEDICPGAADRIISMAEDSLEHQKTMDHKVIDSQVTDMKQSRLYGFLALMALILAALICGLNDKETLAAMFLGTGVIGTIGAFIKSKMSN